MTERKLLELAAKAAGIELVWHIDDDDWSIGMCNSDFCFIPSAKAPHNRRLGDEMQGEVWNPLKDDGDAFRLATLMNIDIVHDRELGMCECHYGDSDWLYENYGNDKYAATRRAIVRAAADNVSSTQLTPEHKPLTVWEASNKTFRVICATRKIAESFAATATLGIQITEISVIQS
jgi:hypothetical protein